MMASLIWVAAVIALNVYSPRAQTKQWFGLEPYANKPLMGTFAAIYDDKLYLIGGEKASVSQLDLSDMYLNTYDILYQPDLNIGTEWQTQALWYDWDYGLFCNQSCSTQIEHQLYIIAPYMNRSNVITATNALFIYDLIDYQFRPRALYTGDIPGDSRQQSCVLNNEHYIFMIGGAGYTDSMVAYDKENDTWITFNATLNIGRMNFGCAFDADFSRIFVFGGDTAWNESTASIEVYSMAEGTWQILHNTSSTSALNQGTEVTLSLKRSKLNAVLNRHTNKVYIFGGGGCSKMENLCSNYWNLVQVFDINTYSLSLDEAMLGSAISDSFSSLYWEHNITSGDQHGSWFHGIFVIGGRTEDVNATKIVQYRMPESAVINNEGKGWTPEPVTTLLFVFCGLLFVLVLSGFIYERVKRYTDTRLLCVAMWLLCLMDVVFDIAFNVRLWKEDKWGLATCSLLAIIVRLVYNIGYSLQSALDQWKMDMTIRERINEYLYQFMSPFCECTKADDTDVEWLLYVLAVCSGSSHGLINLLNSNLFGLPVFNMGLIERHLIEFNLTRLPSGVGCGNVPQLIVQLLYLLEWGMFNKVVLWAFVTSALSLCVGILHIIVYKQSSVQVRRLMLDEDFTKPYFVIFRSQEIGEIGAQLIHRPHAIVDTIAQMINVESHTVEINLCQVVPQGIKISFVEYSNYARDAAKINADLMKSVEEGWFPAAIRSAWKLQEEPMVELWDEQQMYEHKQLLTLDLTARMRTIYGLYGNDNSCRRCMRTIFCCACCDQCGDILRSASQR